MLKLICEDNKIAKKGDYISFNTMEKTGAINSFSDKCYRLVELEKKLELCALNGTVLVGELEKKLGYKDLNGHWFQPVLKNNYIEELIESNRIRADGTILGSGFDYYLACK